MTRLEYIAKIVADFTATYSNALPVRGAFKELAGKVFDALNPLVTVLTADTALTEDQSGGIFLIGTDAKVITLPATKAGLKYTFINSGANGNNIITVSPAAADGIAGTVTLASTVVVLDGTVDKDLINTKASSKTGDAITVIGTGVTGITAWIAIQSSGIWARQT